MEIKIESLSKEELEDWLSIAFYGSFWAGIRTIATQSYKEAKGEYLEEKLAYILMNGGSIAIRDIAEDKIININYDDILRGFELTIENGYPAFIDDMDLIEADRVLQYACFGEVIYG